MPRRRNGWYWIGMAVVLVGLTGYANHHDLMGLYIGYQDSERKVHDLELSLKSLKTEEARLNRSVQGLLNADSLEMEATIRGDRGLVREGETVYRVEIPEDSVP